MVEEKKKKDWERGEGSGIEDLVEMEGGSPEQQRWLSRKTGFVLMNPYANTLPELLELYLV